MLEQNRIEWDGMGWDGMEWTEMEWNGKEYKQIRIEQNPKCEEVFQPECMGLIRDSQ